MRIDDWFTGLAVPGLPDEHEVKALLAHYDIAVPRGMRLGPVDTSPAEAAVRVEFAPPYVVKVCSAHILHKTEQNGVALNLTRQTLPDTIRDLQERFPGAFLLVEEDIHWQGNEFILGALVDPSFGPALMIGAGGILTELYKDVSFRLLPCTLEEARRMLRELIVSPVLEGYRGLRIDSDALAETIIRVGRFVQDLGARFNQLDINPLVYAEGRWVVLDAKLVLSAV